jgi:parallel beta-helix repeat protein
MTADLGPCPGHGLVVRSHVTLTCQGFTISGLGDGSEQYGIYLDGDTGAEVTGATVQGCQVSGFQRGIRLRAADQNAILDNVTHGNGDFTAHVGYGIDVAVGSKNNLIQGNTIAANADEGIHFGADTGPNQFVDNVLFDNYREQIYVLSSDGNTLLGNTTYGAGSNSLYLKDSANNRLERNTFKDHTTKVIGDSSGNQFVDNTFVNSTLQFTVYSATPDRIPNNNSVVGGSMTHTGTCLRFSNTWGNVVGDVALPSCGTQVRSDSSQSEPSSNIVVGLPLVSSRLALDTNSALSIGWWFDLRVQDASGAPVAGARVQATDADGVMAFDLTTDASGALPTQALAQYTLSSTSSVLRTPYTLSTSKVGYLADTRAIDVAQDLALTVVLSRETSGSAISTAFLDDFNRADSTVPGNGWLEAQGHLVVAATELRTSGAKGYNIAVQPGLTGATESVAGDFASVDNSTRARFGVVLRFVDALNYYVFYRKTGGSSMLRISKVIDGVETVLTSASLPNPARNTFFRLGGRAEGTTLTLELNGVPQLAVSDSSLESGSTGVVLGSASTKIHRADNFSASVQ